MKIKEKLKHIIWYADLYSLEILYAVSILFGIAVGVFAVWFAYRYQITIIKIR